jgi:hypothetical protein
VRYHGIRWFVFVSVLPPIVICLKMCLETREGEGDWSKNLVGQ